MRSAKGKKDEYATISADIESMRKYLRQQRAGVYRLHLTFEISGQAGFIYDSLIDSVDTITVSNPSKMTWIYRTAKKTDRIDARKQAVLLSIGEIPAVHMPSRQVRQWRNTILHRRKIVSRITAIKNRIRAVLKSVGFKKVFHRGSWWKKANRFWMRSLAEEGQVSSEELWRMNLCKLRDELLNRELFLHIDELRYVGDHWRMDYNHYRPHSSLDYMAPAAFAAKCLEQGSATLRLPQDKENVCDILS